MFEAHAKIARFGNMAIGARLALGFALILSITALIGTVGLISLSDFTGEVARLRDNVHGSTELADAESALWRLRWDVAQYIAVQDPEERRRIVENGPVQQQIVNANLERFEQAPRSAEELAAEKEVRDGFARYMSARPKWFELYGAGRFEEAADWRAKTITAFGAATVKSFAKLIRLQREASERSQMTAMQKAVQSRNFLMLLLVIAMLSGVALAYGITRAITRPLERAVAVSQEVASGNLRVGIEVHGQDETGRLLQAQADMRDSLANAVGAIRASAESVGVSSRQIAIGNTEMSARIEQQAANLEESAGSMEQLTAAVKQNTENAGHANELAMGAAEVAGRGGEAMSQVTATMASISESSRRIVEIVGVIDSIAFQTNILALNAAVEAARAGEQGRGFAVVASEVRGLAQRSASAAREIKGLIEESASRVDGGAKLVESAGVTMSEIVSAVDRVKGIMGQISAASREQLAGIEQVASAVTEMDRMTQQNAALIEQSASAAENMAQHADRLVAAVARFQVEAHVASEPVPGQAAARPITTAGPRSPARSVRVQPRAAGRELTVAGD